jgi:hypothetical protein
MKPTRTSLNARATRASLSYFSYATGTSSMNKERKMLVTDTKMANPDRPATGDPSCGQQAVCSGRNWVQRTWSNVPLGLETGHACETCHGNKVEEYLRNMEHDHWFGDDHLTDRESRTRDEGVAALSTRRWERTHVIFKRDDALVSASNAGKRGGFV